MGRLCLLCGFQFVTDGFTGSGLLRDGVVDGSSGILHIGADILDAFRKANGAVLVLDVGQPDFIGGKINRVNSALDAIHIQCRTDRNVICGFEFLEGLAVLAEKDICAGLPELVRTGYPRTFTKASDRNRRLAAYLLLKELCAEQGCGFFRVLAVQLKIAVLGKADQRVRMSLFDCLIFAEFCDGERQKHLCPICLRQSVTAAFLFGQHFRQSIRVLRERLVGFDAAMLTDQSHCCIEAAAAGRIQHKAIREGQPVMIRRNRVLRHICRLFPVVDLKDIPEHLATLDGFRDNDAGNALVIGLFGVKTEGVVIPRSLNEDLIFVEAVRSVRAAEPHQRFVFGIPAFGSAADDTLVDVEVFLVAV